MTRFYVTEKLSPRQSLTPEGFLLCEEVPIARTGKMTYTDREVPIQGDDQGLVTIVRDENEVFRPEFIASFAGKPVVDDHPDEDVNPKNWAQHARGTVLNPRRGEGPKAEYLFADLLICDENAIRAVSSGKREVSCGYDAEYEETSRGVGRQYNMIGNHVALVESGRCGPRCAIGDRKTTLTGDSSMSTKTKRKWLDSLAARLRKAVKAKDEAAVEEVLADAESEIENLDEDPDTHLHIHSPADSGEDPLPRSMTDEDINSRFETLESGMQGIMDSLEELKAGGSTPVDADPIETEGEITDADLEEEVPAAARDSITRARDSAPLQESFQETLAMAEILVPGIRLPVYDAKANPRKTMDAICALRKQALDLAYHQPATRAIIDEVHGGRELQLGSMRCRDARTLFRAAAALKKSSNARDSHVTQAEGPQAGGGLGVKGPVKTPAQLNEALRKYYGGGK